MLDDAVRFRNEFRDGYNECFPQKRVKIRKIDVRKPWLDDDTLKGKIKERNRLYTLKLKASNGLVPEEADQLRTLTSEVGQLRQGLKNLFLPNNSVRQARTLGQPGGYCMTTLGRLAKGGILLAVLFLVVAG